MAELLYGQRISPTRQPKLPEQLEVMVTCPTCQGGGWETYPNGDALPCIGCEGSGQQTVMAALTSNTLQRLLKENPEKSLPIKQVLEQETEVPIWDKRKLRKELNKTLRRHGWKNLDPTRRRRLLWRLSQEARKEALAS